MDDLENKVSGLVEDNSNNGSNNEDDSSVWGYEVLESGELGAIAGLTEIPSAEAPLKETELEQGQEQSDFSLENVGNLAIDGGVLPLIGRNQEELLELFDNIDQISRNFYLLNNNPLAQEISEKLRLLAEEYRKDPESFLQKNAQIDFSKLPNNQ